MLSVFLGQWNHLYEYVALSERVHHANVAIAGDEIRGQKKLKRETVLERNYLPDWVMVVIYHFSLLRNIDIWLFCEKHTIIKEI